jgi:hypothetical protein
MIHFRMSILDQTLHIVSYAKDTMNFNKKNNIYKNTEKLKVIKKLKTQKNNLIKK